MILYIDVDEISLNENHILGDSSSDSNGLLSYAKAAGSNNDESILKADYSETSFMALNKTINETTDLEIVLENDYTYDGSSDSELKDGIIINKSITIDGNGKTISGNGQARIFYITSGAVVIIKNLNLINGNTEDGGAIYVDSGTLTISDSNMTHNKASSGGAIYNNGGTVIVNNSIFTNNNAGAYGGAIYNRGQVTVSNSLFESNTAEYNGGAIQNYKQLKVIKSTFKGNKANMGAAASNWFGIMNITESVFENNVADNRGGALYSRTLDDGGSDKDKYQHISYSNFTNNTARGVDYSGGVIYATGYLNATGTYSPITMPVEKRQLIYWVIGMEYL